MAFIEVFLSADNAVVLALLTYSLPIALRRRALYIGLLSAFFLRAAALFAASYILQSMWLEILGSAYLFYLVIDHFVRKRKKHVTPAKTVSFWKIVFLIEFFDLAFALDSIIAGIAFIATPSPHPIGSFHPKLWIVYVGGMLGVVTIRYAADLFSRLIDRFQNLENSAYLLIGWIALKLLLEATIPQLPGFEVVFWLVFALILGGGFLKIKLR